MRDLGSRSTDIRIEPALTTVLATGCQTLDPAQGQNRNLQKDNLVVGLRGRVRKWSKEFMKYPTRRFIILLVFCFALPALATQRNVVNYGATGNGSTDDSGAINSAINAMGAGDELFFPCPSAYYKLAGPLNPVSVNNAIVDGQTGCSGGRVMIKSTVSGTTVMTIYGGQNLSGTTPITATTTDLQTTLQANFSAIGAGIGNYVYLEESEVANDPGHTNCSGSGCRGEVVKITGLSGSTATLETAVHHVYDTAFFPWVQKLVSPVSGVNVHDLTFDGSGVAANGLNLPDTVNATVNNVTAQNITQVGIQSFNNYNDSFTNITITHAGNPGQAAVTLSQAGNLNVNGASLSSLNAGAFGFIITKMANATFANITVDATGTGSGRPVKTNSVAHSTFNTVSANHGEGGYFGISVEYFSHHNVWNNCRVTNNIGSNNHGIVIFGDSSGGYEGSNHYNTFNNCTVTGNSGFPFTVSDNNTNTEISGGTYASTSSAYVAINVTDGGGPCCANNTYIHNASVTGPAGVGIGVGAGSSNACINNNTLTAGSSITTGISVSTNTDIGSGNVLNGSSSNLTAGTCGGGASPVPPTGLTATVN